LHSQALQDALTAHPALLDWPAPAAEEGRKCHFYPLGGPGEGPKRIPSIPLYTLYYLNTLGIRASVTIVDREARAEQLGRSVAGHLMEEPRHPLGGTKFHRREFGQRLAGCVRACQPSIMVTLDVSYELRVGTFPGSLLRPSTLTVSRQHSHIKCVPNPEA
jgi:hypothetical protein